MWRREPSWPRVNILFHITSLINAEKYTFKDVLKFIKFFIFIIIILLLFFKIFKINNSLSFTINTDVIREFHAYEGSDFAIPRFVGKIENQNLIKSYQQ